MKNKLFAQVTVALSGAAVIAAGTAMPVMADPVSVNKYAELVGLGSDTTMDVMDGISLALGDVSVSDTRLKLASYKAIGSADVVVSADGIAIPRANGSSAGRDALRIAIGQINSGSVAIAPDDLGKSRSAASPTTAQLAGKFHYARSSSGPSGAVANGVVTYVPFAQDNMTYATAPLNVTKIPSDIPVGSAGNTSEVSLMNIYKGNITQVIEDASDGAFIKLAAPSYTPAAGEVATTIRAYVPQAGSGTRSFWNSTVGITDAGITNGTFPAKDITPGGVTVQEHDGTAVATDPYALVGFSISQWVAQTNGVAPKRTAGAVLRSIGGLEPVVVTDGVYATAPTWSAIKRAVYNIVPTALINADEENAYTRAFRGTNSLVCQAKAVIQKFGYGLLSYTGVDAELGETTGGQSTICGNIIAANRVYAPSASTVTLGTPVVAASGSSATVTATVASNGNQGGTVTLFSGFGTPDQAEVASGVVAKGATTVDITVTNTTAAAFEKTVTAQFVPVLTGVDVSSSTINGTTITLAAPAVAKTATSVSFGAATVATNGLSATFTATFTGGQNGNLNIYNTDFSGAILKTVAVTGATATVTIDQANGEKVSYNLVGEFVPSNAEVATSSRTTSALPVALKNTSYTLITVGASYKTSALPTVSVTIKAGKTTSNVGATGTVFAVVYNSKKVPVQVSSALVKLSAGKATLKFAKITTVGTYTVKVFYGGSADVAESTTTKTFKVTK